MGEEALQRRDVFERGEQIFGNRRERGAFGETSQYVGDLVAAAEQRGRNGLQAAAAFECVFERGYLGERVGRVFGERFQVGAEVERIVHRGQVYVAPLFDGRQVAAGGFGVSLQAVELFHRTGYGHFVDARFRIFIIYQAARRGVEGQGEFLAVSVAVIDRAVDGAGERQYDLAACRDGVFEDERRRTLGDVDGGRHLGGVVLAAGGDRHHGRPVSAVGIGRRREAEFVALFGDRYPSCVAGGVPSLLIRGYRDGVNSPPLVGELRRIAFQTQGRRNALFDRDFADDAFAVHDGDCGVAQLLGVLFDFDRQPIPRQDGRAPRPVGFRHGFEILFHGEDELACMVCRGYRGRGSVL